jgi:preprotein translocase subunit SecE
MKAGTIEDLGIHKDTLNRLRQYISEVRSEMKRVTWPSKQEVYGTTVMVIITSFLFGAYFMLCDHIFGPLIVKILNHFSHRG